MSQTVRVNFGRPIPLFPLPEIVLLPHAVKPLQVFETRYRRMVEDALDEAGQIAMASFAGEQWKTDYQGLPSLRPAVCVGQIIQHETMPDGNHIILLHGVCRAVIKKVLEPSGECPYRQASLVPLETFDDEPAPMAGIRTDLRRLLAGPRLKRLRGASKVLEWFDRDDVPTHALLELIAFTLVQDAELKYCLLAEANARRRAHLIRHELSSIDRLVQVAEHQSFRAWPKGMSWN
jgi:Lon protease-like protein